MSLPHLTVRESEDVLKNKAHKHICIGAHMHTSVHTHTSYNKVMWELTERGQFKGEARTI